MKTQRVEIELPDFDGYEFDGHRTPTLLDSDESYVCMSYPQCQMTLESAKHLSLNYAEKYFFFRKKKPRRIIYEEVKEDHLNRGDFYLIDSDVYMWTSDTQSSYKRQILKKVHDDFEVNND